MADTVVSIRWRTIGGIEETAVTLAAISSTVPLASADDAKSSRNRLVKNAAENRRILFPSLISERTADAEMHAVALGAVRKVDPDRSHRRLDAQTETD